MYYRLKAPWAFRGWKKLPCALQAQYGEDKHERPHFMKKEPFMDLLYCNGVESVTLEEFCEEARQIVKELLSHDAMEQSETPLPPLEGWQRYHVFPSRYIESVHWSITGNALWSRTGSAPSATVTGSWCYPKAESLRTAPMSS